MSTQPDRSSRDRRPPTSVPARSLAGQALALAGAALLVTALFAPWADPTRRALHTALLGPREDSLTVGLALAALAGVCAFGAVAGDRGWPRLVAAIGVGLTVLVHLDGWTSPAVPSGAWLALVAAILELLAAALATGAPARTRLTRQPRPAPAGPHLADG